MGSDRRRVCPVEHAGVLDFSFRRIFHNPEKILKPHIRKGMTVLEPGCGPGFFTSSIAELAGDSGRVIAADIQTGMLDKVRIKMEKSRLSRRVELHLCGDNGIGLSVQCDIVLLFYMLHEVQDLKGYVQEIASLVKPNGKILLVEPNFHVSKKNFLTEIKAFENSGFKIMKRPRILFSRTALMGKS